MVTVGRAWSCAPNCDPTGPCYIQGCPNARQGYYSNPYFNRGFGPRPYYNSGPNSYYNRGPNPYYYTNPPPFWYRRSSPPFRPPPPRPQWYPDSNYPNNTIRIGVGNVSSTDIDIDVRDNLVRGGRRRVGIGSGNYATRSNMGVIANNKADADDLLLGVDNISGGDNNIRVTDNDFRGFGTARVGSGNYACGSNRIVVDGLGSDNGGSGSGWGGYGRPQQVVQQRRRWWWS